MTSSNETCADILARFDITQNGFLPIRATPQTIRAPYDHWKNICDRLATLVESHDIEKIVEDLPVIAIDGDTTDDEYKHIYAMLCMIQAAWLWHRGEGNHKDYVPKQICVPLKTVADHLGIPAILTHAAIDLYNWRLRDVSKPPILDNLVSAYTLTGNISESWFCLVMVAIEYLGAVILKNIVNISIIMHDSNMDGNTKNRKIVEHLTAISDRMDEINIVISRMQEKCDPKFFYNTLRKFLSGWTNKELFPVGVKLETIADGVRYTGGSAAQSSLIQAIDIFLGITHTDGYLRDMRNYMPQKHREFLVWLESRPCVRNYIDHDVTIKNLYNDCIDKLTSFRKRHHGLVHTYILKVVQEKQAEKNSALAAEGTGGSNLATFLKEIRDDTVNKRV